MQAIEEELIRLKEGGACIVLATHNIAQAHRLADRIIVLHHGEALPPENPLAAELLKGKWPVAT